MYEKFLVIAHKMESNSVLDSIKRGFLVCVPLLMVGIISQIVLSIPIDSVQNWYLSAGAGSIFYRLFQSIYSLTFGPMALYLCIAVSFMYAAKFHTGSRFVTAAAVLASFFSTLFSLGYAHTGFAVERYNAGGVFTAFVVSVICIKLFFTIYGFIGKRKQLSFAANMERRIYTIYWMMIPFCICIFLFFGFNEVLYHVFHVVSINDAFTEFVAATFMKMGPSYGSAMLLMGAESLLWFFGVHGGSVMEQVMDMVFTPANLDAEMIVSRTFLDTFTLMGGCGTAICLFIAMIFFEKRKEQRALLGTVALPIFFNVNEPLVFGVPIVFNPVLVIPFILTPLLSLSIAYAATYIGFMPVTLHEVPWTTPIFISGYYATGSWRGSLVQLIIILVGILVYIPFVKMMEKTEAENIELSAESLETYYKNHVNDFGEVAILKQHNSMAIAASALVSKLKDDIAGERINLYYQPQMDKQGKVYGAEALLRWNYGGKMLFPPFVIHMAREAGIENQLGRTILRQVCRDIQELKKEGMKGLRVSANISGEQINDNIFVTDIILIANRYQVCDQLCIEVTEDIDLENLNGVTANIGRLKAEGIQVSMDDFSMGTTSIKNLQTNQFSHVKLDGGLVADMATNERSRDIVASIIHLGNSLGFRVVAEYVDSQRKLDELKKLGCDYFQGYYYSPAVPLVKFMEFAKRQEDEKTEM